MLRHPLAQGEHVGGCHRLVGLARSLAVDYGPTVRVNALLPGGVATRLWERIDPAECQECIAAMVLRRLASPDEVAEGSSPI